MSRMVPTPIRTAPSSAPLETMVAKQQAHIDELVIKNRSFEMTVQQLQTELASEKVRYDDALQKVKAQYDGERKKWKEDSDMLEGLWRISYLREVTKRAETSGTILDMKNELRLAKLAILQRDFNLEMFRAKESEWDDKIAELEAAKDDAKWEMEEIEAQYAAVDKERALLAEQLEAQQEELVEVAQEKKELEETLQSLRKEHTALLTSSTTESSSLERLKLQLEGTHASYTELQQKHSELERANADMVRQLEKWRNLENRDGAELEDLRKRKIELEVEVEELRQAAEKREQKFQKKLERYKESLNAHVVAFKEDEEVIAQQDAEISQLKSQLTESETKIESLQQELDEAELRSAAPSEKKAEKRRLEEQLADKDRQIREIQAQLNAHKKAKRSKPTEAAVEEPKDEQERLSPSSPVVPKPKFRPRPRPVIQERSSPSDDDDIQEIDPPPTRDKPKKHKKPRPIETEDEQIHEIEAPPSPGVRSQHKGKGREIEGDAEDDARQQARPARERKAKAKKKTAATEDSPKTTRSTDAGPSSSKGGKRRAQEVDEDGEDYVEPPKPKKRSKKNADDEDRPALKAQGKSAAKSKPKAKKNPFLDSDNDDDVVQPKKPKRKINISSQLSFPAPPKLDLSFAPQGDKSLSIDIPTELSPVKDNAGQHRAVSALGRNISSLMGTFPRR